MKGFSKIGEFLNEFLETSKVKMVFLPPYSPNLNIIERLWKFFKQKVLRGYYYENFEEFREKTIDFFRNVAIIYKEELNTLLAENFSFEYG
ncbi:MAG: transposase [bacterium]